MTYKWEDIDIDDRVTLINPETEERAEFTVTDIDNDFGVYWIYSNSFGFGSDGKFKVEKVEKPAPAEPGIGGVVFYTVNGAYETAVHTDILSGVAWNTSEGGVCSWDSIVSSADEGSIEIVRKAENVSA